MKKIITVVYDMKAQHFSEFPIPAANRMDAIRAFEHALQNKGTALSNFPYDFILYEVGEYDMKHGTIKVHDKPQLIVSAVDILGPKDQDILKDEKGEQ